MGENSIKTVDVVIPCYKPDKGLMNLIQRLEVQKHRVNRIIIVNTRDENEKESDILEQFMADKGAEESSSGAEKKILTADDVATEDKADKIYNRIEVHNIEKKNFNHGLTRNYGLSFSKADYVVFMTQDAIPADDNLITEIIKPFEDEDVYVSYARQLPKKNCKYVEKYIRSFNYPSEDMVKTKEDFDRLGIKTIFCSDVCAAYRRSAHEELGGFVKTDFNEDMIFAYNVVMAGKKVYYSANAKVFHSHNYSYMQQYKRNVEIGKSQVEFDYIFGKIKSESEGVRMIKKGTGYLLRNGKWYLIPDLYLSSAFKYIGFCVGKKKAGKQKYSKSDL